MDNEIKLLLARLVVAMEGVHFQLARINDEGLVVINDAGMNEN